MVELSTGYLDLEQLDTEIINIVDDLLAFGVEIAYVTFGFGCERDMVVQWEEISVPIRALIEFVANSESQGTFDLGEADLHIRADAIEFRLCHERDVHCSGEECTLLAAVRIRWAREYEHSCEQRSGGVWRRLNGRPKDSRHG